MINKRLCLGMFFILGILIFSSSAFAYTQSYYSSQHNNAIGLGIFSSGQSLRMDDSMCQQGDDFIIQIGPLSCTPTVVRSDLLEEENVNVFCQMTATQINPFVDVQRIDSISFQREYPKEVLSLGYQPAQSALGYLPDNLEGSLLMQNLGYVVITLRRQPNESALTNCKKGILGSEVCWVEGNLTANLRYDVQNVFGVGKAVFYLPVMDDDVWEKNYIPYSFWEGRGYLRASSVGESDAVLSVYSDNSVASSLLSPGVRKYTLARYSSNIPLDVGDTSDKLFLPGLSPCLASLQLRLEGIVNPDTRAMIKVNEDYTEIAKGETFLEGKCRVSDLQKDGVTSKVKIICSGADSASERKPFELRIFPKVNLSINGVKKGYNVGDFLYKLTDGTNSYKEKYIYLGYVGTVGEATDVNSLYVTLVAIPSDEKDGSKDKLTDSEITSVASWSETAMSSPDSGSGGLNFAIKAFDKFVSTTMYVGKAVITGENFVNVPYIGAGSAPVKFKGTDVVLGGFYSGVDDGVFSSDNQNFTNAMSDFSTVVNSYPNEVEKANSIQSLGEKAFYEKIYLTNALGMRKTVMELCDEFAQSYPDTYENLGICTDIVKLSSNEEGIKEITINGITKRISFDGIKEPSKNDYSAEVIVQGPNRKILSYVLEKNKMIQLTGFRTDADQKNLTTIEYIKLEDLSTASATVRVNVAGQSAISNVLTSDNKLLTKGESQTYGGYTFTLKEVNLNQVAKVSVISNQEFAKSNSTFNFKIGIEKRSNLLQLSPEKAKEKIISQNKSIADLEKISNSLYGVVKTMKAACAVTGVYLTAKNFVANAGGKAIARQEVMGKTGDGGWNDKCAQLIRQYPKEYKTLDACFLKFSDQIEKEVNNTYKIIQYQNNEIANLEKANGDSYDNPGFINKYSENIAISLDSASVTQALSSLTNEQKKNLDLEKVKSILNSDKSYTDYYGKNAYTLDQLKEIELYSSYINKYGTDSNDQTVINAKNKLISVLSDVYVNSNKFIPTANLASSMGIDSNKITYIQTNIDTKKYIYEGLTNADTKIANIPSETPVAVVQTETGNYIFILNKGSGTNEGTRYIISKVYDAAGKLVDPSSPNYQKLTNAVFEEFDATSYKNQYKASYGNSEVLMRYYEVVPYKGLPAIVPFDLKSGWYAGIQSPQTSYDASGRVVSFWLCNVMENGIEQFQLENFGGDSCTLFNLNTGQTLSNFPGLKEGETRVLVDKAKNAIEAAQRAYKAGVTKVNGIKIGEPPTQSSASQCTDLMSAKDCNLLFNVCDPVVCPPSRCNLGGNYPVTNVIQTGIIGSIALCYPNAKWNGGDVYVPVCLSGVQAGLDNWLSIKKSYRDCLQKSIDTGETVGICDEINSIYTCEFFWKQSLPIIKYALPKIAGKITGQSGNGGGEYNGITSALDSVKKSVDYFKQYYAANSYNAFKVRSTEQVGTELCGSFISAIYPDSGSFLDNLITPDSPVQFTGKFDEIQQTTTTNPPTSQYKVYYHIYAGKDTGVYYTVYLRGSGSSYYQDTAQNRLVKSSYVAKGDYASETVDFTAPSGYQQLCIVVNGQEECNFKEVSTSFAVNYLSDLYLAQQASTTDIKTEEECISGTTSLYNLLNLNAEAATNNLINPAIYAQGIIRICSTGDPGVGTDISAGLEGSRWKKVGYCGQKAIGCWIDTESVKNVIKTMNIENKALSDITNASLQNLSQNYLTPDQFNAKMAEINAETSNAKKIELITAILNRIYYNNQKAQLFYGRGIAYSELAISEYNVLIAAKQAAAAVAAANGETISEFDKTYISPIFTFQDGTSHKNVCYRYFDSKWHWMIASTGMGTAIIPSCNDPNFPRGRKWFDATVFKDESDQIPTDKSVAFINSLNGKYYLDGLALLAKRTIANSEGGMFDADLVAGDSKLSNEGIFKVGLSGAGVPVLYYKYAIASSMWQWSPEESTWMNVDTFVVNGGNLNGEVEVQKNKDLITSLQGKELYNGAAVLFDPISTEVKEFFKTSTAGRVTTGTSLEGSFEKRDQFKLAALMQDLSTTAFQSSFKCNCGNNCGDYAKWITEASSKQSIPDELLLLAIMIQESSCQSVSSSNGEDIGLMQINAKVHCVSKLSIMDTDACKSILLSDNEKNINVGAQVLKESYRAAGKSFNCGSIVKTYGGWEAALRGYNGWGCTGDNNYVDNVETKYFELVNLYNGRAGITCTSNQIKCEGTIYFICTNNAWISQGNVNGKCGYAPSSGEIDLTKFSNTELDVITKAASCINCGEGLLNSCDEAECKAIGSYLKRSCLYSFGECIENSAVTPSDESIKIELAHLLDNKLSSTEKSVVTQATACTECGNGFFNSCDEQECRALSLQLKKKCAYISGTCKEDTTGTSGCTDTCSSLGYKCGSQTVCGKSINCGTCTTTGQDCNSLGKCVPVVDGKTTCSVGQTGCNEKIYFTCENSIWVSQGFVDGKCGYVSTNANATCTDTCSKLGYKCGSHTICGKITDCGLCATGQTCNSAGQCIGTTTACNVGETKCEGTTYFTCTDSIWVSQGKVNNKCGYTSSSGTTTQEVFVIKPNLLQNILGGINGEDIYYKNENGWKWTPYPDKSTWMSTVSSVTSTGKYTGKIPSSKNVAIIESINGKSYYDGKNILKDNGGVMENGSAISLLPVQATTCAAGQTKCEGTNYFTCLNNAWVAQGNIDGQCGYVSTPTTCTMPQTKCTGTTYFVCIDNAWVSQGTVDGKCGYTALVTTCSMPQEKCEGMIYIICINNAWVSQGLILGECGYGLPAVITCTSGSTKCEGTTYFICTNSVWISQGQVSGKCGYTAISTTNNREKIINAARDLVGKPFIKYTELTYSQRAEVDKSKTIWTWKGIPIIRDYDNSGSVYPNCFDSVMHVYEKAGVKWGSFAYCLKDEIVDIDQDGCNKNTDITKDEVIGGDILSIRYNEENHNVIFLRWGDKLSGRAEIFDWIGRADKSEFPTSFTGNTREFRTMEVNLKFDEKSEDWTVYAIGKPSA